MTTLCLFNLLTTGDMRPKFERYLRELINKQNLTEALAIPEDDSFSLYDYRWDADQLEWVSWVESTKGFRLNIEQPFNEMIIPTNDTVRYSLVFAKLIECGHHVLCVGVTGTGKTLLLNNMLSAEIRDSLKPVFMTFSARTRAKQVCIYIPGLFLSLHDSFFLKKCDCYFIHSQWSREKCFAFFILKKSRYKTFLTLVWIKGARASLGLHPASSISSMLMI